MASTLLTHRGPQCGFSLSVVVCCFLLLGNGASILLAFPSLASVLLLVSDVPIVGRPVSVHVQSGQDSEAFIETSFKFTSELTSLCSPGLLYLWALWKHVAMLGARQS